MPILLTLTWRTHQGTKKLPIRIQGLHVALHPGIHNTARQSGPQGIGQQAEDPLIPDSLSDYADEIADLSVAIEEERGLCLAFQESHNVDLAKLQKDLDHGIVLTRVLRSEKVALGVGHDILKEEFRTLYKAHKVLKGVHVSHPICDSILKELKGLTKDRTTY